MGWMWHPILMKWAYWRRFVNVVVVLCLGLSLAWMNAGCASSIGAIYPQARVERICLRVPGVKPDERNWVYSEGGEAISSENAEEFDRIARRSVRIYEYDPGADAESVQKLPSPHNELVCPERFRPLGPKEAEEEELPEEGLFFVDEERCRRLYGAKAPSRAGVYLGDALPTVYVKDKCMAPRVATSRERSIQGVEKQLSALGKQYGVVFGTVDGAFQTLNSVYQGTYWYQVKKGRAGEIADMYAWLAKELESLPAMPTYDDAELAAAALRGFEAGFGAGFGEALRRAAALNTACTAALAAAGNVATVVESAGAKALQVALTRIRAMPLFVPGTASGAGFFLRIPKPPPANANAPSLRPGVIAPPATSPPPFGNLSRAAEFGIQTEAKLSRAIAGTGLEKHHLIEQRFAEIMEGDPRMNLTVAVTSAEHQAFTNKWRNLIPYAKPGAPAAERGKIIEVAREIYKDYPAILKALDL